jgi:carbohydrate kinase (thermoresistant glucokinase family)
MAPHSPLAIIVMGVSGCGKSTVGMALATALHIAFYDADDFHPPANKEKMRAGIALNDTDRAPWLATLNALLKSELAAGRSCVLACSALKRSYRDALAAGNAVKFVHISGTFDEIQARLAARSHEYMPATLLQSQFTTLEPPTDAITIPLTLSLAQQVQFAKSAVLGDNL